MLCYDSSDSISNESFCSKAFLESCLNDTSKDQCNSDSCSRSDWTFELSEADQSDNGADKDKHRLLNPLEAFDIYKTFHTTSVHFNWDATQHDHEESSFDEDPSVNSGSADKPNAFDFEKHASSLPKETTIASLLIIPDEIEICDNFEIDPDAKLKSYDVYSDSPPPENEVTNFRLLSAETGNQNEPVFFKSLEARLKQQHYNRHKALVIQQLLQKRCIRFLSKFQIVCRTRFVMKKLIFIASKAYKKYIFLAWIKFINKCDKEKAARMIWLSFTAFVRLSVIKSFQCWKVYTSADRYSSFYSLIWPPIVTSIYRSSFLIWIKYHEWLKNLVSTFHRIESTISSRYYFSRWRNETQLYRKYERLRQGFQICRCLLIKNILQKWHCFCLLSKKVSATKIQSLVRRFLVRLKMREVLSTHFFYCDSELDNILGNDELESLLNNFIDDSTADKYLKECEICLLSKTSNKPEYDMELDCFKDISNKAVYSSSTQNVDDWKSASVAKVRFSYCQIKL